MRQRSMVPIATAGAALLLALALSPGLAKGPGDPEPPLTLRLLVWDHENRQSQGAVDDLVRLANETTDGAITIVPTFDGGGGTAAAVMSGETELAMLASREWDAAGVTSLDALEAPFLIDNDALARAVSTSDIATDAMAGLGGVGVTGLAMWPEDLRHLFAFNPSGTVFTTPADVTGADVLVVAGTPGHDLITTLGGRIYSEDGPAGDLTGDRVADAVGGTLDGMVTGLWGAGLPIEDTTVAGDLPVHAKFQMLVGNTAVLTAMTDRQRQLFDQIVVEMHTAAIGRQLTEAGLAQERCAAGGTVSAIGADGHAAFVAAAQPLTDRLAADPVTGPLMVRIGELKDQTPASPDAGTCEPASPAGSLAPDAGFIGDQPIPDGSYRIDVTADELRAAGATAQFAGLNAGTWTWSIEGDSWEARHDVRNEHCTGGVEVADGVVRFTDAPVDTGCGMGYEVRWREVPGGIELQLVDLTAGGTDTQVEIERSFIDRTWTRLD